MIPYAEALSRLLAMAAPLAAEQVSLAAARGRVPVASLAALRTQPPFAASAMDGYAVRSVDLPGPLALIGEAAAGAEEQELHAGEAIRIFTGAPVPIGADAVLVQEDAVTGAGVVQLAPGAARPRAGANVRPAGGDFVHGDAIAPAGEPLGPAAVGLLAAAGHASVLAHRRPLAALLATGNELVPPGGAPTSGQIFESNRAALAALLAPVADVLDLGIAPDNPEVIAAAALRGAEADIFVTIGGASVGDHDLVRPALMAAGGEIGFWKVAIRPGKPMIAGRLGGAVVVGLPGNPASAFVTAHLFLLPLVRRLGGWRRVEADLAPARLTLPIGATGDRRDHLRARYGQEGAERVVTPASAQDSSLIRTLAGSNALIVREPGAPPARAGEIVETLDIRSPPF